MLDLWKPPRQTWRDREVRGFSSASGKYEPIDLFGNRIVLVDRVAMGPECGHPLVENFIRQPCQKRVGAKGGLLNEARPVSGGNLRHDLMHDWRKADRCEN